ncbi:hypothetical protein CYMTET_45481 [Cymbomonas tetramitiformis]|uniref:Uncharacterized protein n=1 Tax=Cymbomonas tetramitiformis TaxID=36881 RepID=A0AAE0EZM9_9CHLO|nr:hypothetical protein CYMTET_45481 [Cymbomonas tetramitiformis]
MVGRCSLGRWQAGESGAAGRDAGVLGNRCQACANPGIEVGAHPCLRVGPAPTPGLRWERCAPAQEGGGGGNKGDRRAEGQPGVGGLMGDLEGLEEAG